MARDTDPILAILPALRRYALSLTRSAADADDLVQEALLRGHRRRETLRRDGELAGWMMSILRNVFLDRFRSERARQRREAEAASRLSDEVPAPQEARMRLVQLRAAYLALPDDQREALTLVAVEGLSYAEAARIAEVPVGTLVSRLARARASLRRFEEDAPPPRLKLVGGSDDAACR